MLKRTARLKNLKEQKEQKEQKHEKIKKKDQTDSTNVQKVEKIEQKINTVEDTFNTNLDSLEQKYAILKDQLVKFSKLIEEDRASKEKAKTKNFEDLKQFETKVKSMMQEEKDFIKTKRKSCATRPVCRYVVQGTRWSESAYFK